MEDQNENEEELLKKINNIKSKLMNRTFSYSFNKSPKSMNKKELMNQLIPLHNNYTMRAKEHEELLGELLYYLRRLKLSEKKLNELLLIKETSYRFSNLKKYRKPKTLKK